MAKQNEETRVIAIPKLNIRKMFVPIVGISPLMQNKPIPEEIKSKDLTPEDECALRCWELEKPEKGYKYGHPATGVKASIVSAARTISSTNMQELAQCFGITILDPSGCVPIDTSGWVIDRRPVTIQKKAMVMWSRPRYDVWGMTLQIEYDADAVSSDDLLGAIVKAGLFVGIGTYRPEKQQGRGGGPFGKFEIGDKVMEQQ